MKKFLLFVVILGAAVYVSYRYSRDVYAFYITKYYRDFRKYDEKMMLDQARVMMNKGDIKGARSFCDAILMIYPDSSEAAILGGMAELRAGDKDKGLSRMISSLKRRDVSRKLFFQSIRILYEEKYYGDIIDLMKGKNSENAEILFYHGVSFYKTGKYRNASDVLMQSIKKGMSGFEAYYYCGLALDKAGDSKEALRYLRRAWDLNSADQDTAGELVNLYRKMGQYQEAEKIIRRVRAK